jgi:hypothetical protein
MNITTHEGAGRFRASIENEIERLIALLDDMEPDPDLEDNGDDEPWLGAQTRVPASWESPWGRSGVLTRDSVASQEEWATGVSDDREVECEGEGEAVDAEYSFGWQNEGSQANLSYPTEAEADLSTTEGMDQARRIIEIDGWHVQDGEPDLGFVGISTGWRPGEVLDDREDENEHRDDSDDEPTMGWTETCGQGLRIGVDVSPAYFGYDPDIGDYTGGPAMFDGSGRLDARNALRAALQKPPLDVLPEYVERSLTLPDGTTMRTFVAANFVPNRTLQ